MATVQCAIVNYGLFKYKVGYYMTFLSNSKYNSYSFLIEMRNIQYIYTCMTFAHFSTILLGFRWQWSALAFVLSKGPG